MEIVSPGTYIINHPGVCVQHTDVLLLVVINSVFAHLDRRTVIRDTWSRKKNYHNSFVHVLFFLTKSENQHVQESIERENELYRDIVQYSNSITDHYNLTLKTTLAGEWSNKFCPDAKYVLVSDDNIVLDVFKILPYLREHMKSDVRSENIALCHYRSSGKEVMPINNLIQLDKYRNFCSNEAYVASPKVLDQLYLTLRLNNFVNQDYLWLSDLAKASGIKYSDTSQHFAGARTKPTVLKSFMSMNYMSSTIMIGIVADTFQGEQKELFLSSEPVIKNSLTFFSSSSYSHFICWVNFLLRLETFSIQLF